MEHLAHWPEIQSFLYHFRKIKYISRKNQCPWPQGCENPLGHHSCWITMPQQVDTCAMSHDNRTPASLVQPHARFRHHFKKSIIGNRAGSPTLQDL